MVQSWQRNNFSARSTIYFVAQNNVFDIYYLDLEENHQKERKKNQRNSCFNQFSCINNFILSLF